MKREPYFTNWKKIFSISFGLVYILFTLWLIFHTKQYVPEGQEDFWYVIFIGYGLLNALILGNADMRNKLFNVKFVEFIPRFLIFFVGGLLFFYILINFFDPLEHSLFGLLQNVPLWLLTIHALVFATTESVIWQGFLDYKIGHPWSELVAGIFHYGIWTGGVLLVVPSAALLFAIFSLVNWYFRINTDDLAPAIGVHTAYNFIKLGIFLAVV